MLDNDSLSQLKQLKKQIEDDKEYAEGVLKATQRKFGFVVTDDGREIYLAPEEMQKAFPGDKVRILVKRQSASQGKNASQGREKVSGLIEKVLNSPVREFAGRYIVKGKGHFVEPDLPRNDRWIFVPPAARSKARSGDFVIGKITRHPFPNGKPQAKVIQVIGSEDLRGIESAYIVAKFQLEPEWPKNWQSTLLEPDTSGRQDLTHIPFVTIDAPGTQDMDDALYAEATESGWVLRVAIADVAGIIAEKTELDKLACKKSTSVYLPGRPVAMLPGELANSRCSLLPDEPRPVMVCTMHISSNGEICSYEFSEATIISQAKLSYEAVATTIDQPQESDASTEAHAACLQALSEASSALLTQRREQHLVIPSRTEFRLILNDQLKLDRIEPLVKTSAHQVVEECMIATNRCGADFIGDQGLFIEHPGFRAERLPDVKKLSQEYLSLEDVAFDSASGYQQLMKAIDDNAIEFPLRAVLSRLLERSRFSLTPEPHQGMGLPRYTTITSPIRKYSDLICQRIIKAKLHQQQPPQCSQQLLEGLQESQDKARQARNQMEQWLKCEYMEGLQGKRFTGTVTQINSNGFTVRLDEHNVEGFVETRQMDEKFSFDPMRLRLKSKRCTIELNQSVQIKVGQVDRWQRSIRFQLELPETIEAATAAATEA